MKNYFDLIKHARKSLQKTIAYDIDSSHSGIILEEFNENNIGWKVAWSHDDHSKIIILESEQLVLSNKVDNETFVRRLLRDISSDDEETKEISSDVLCYFIESEGIKIDENILKQIILKLIHRLKVENNPNVQQKLIEVIIEYIWLETTEDQNRQNIISDLAKLDNDMLFNYFDDEDYNNNIDVLEYLKRRDL